jgi:hypothetical protein
MHYYFIIVIRDIKLPDAKVTLRLYHPGCIKHKILPSFVVSLYGSNAIPITKQDLSAFIATPGIFDEVK